MRYLTLRHLTKHHIASLSAIILATSLSAYAASPWETAVDNLQVAFTGPIARGLGLVAIVVGGLMWAFGEAEKRALAGIIFGVGMAVGAASFYGWLFN